MFVAIDNREMSAPRVLDWINRTKNANNNVISPEFAMEILGKTNFFGHIKTVLKNIKENCKTREDVLPYKEFILSCVDRREMSPDAMKDLQELVKLCGCREEFDKTNDKVKIYKVKDCENADVKIVKSIEEFDALEGEDLRVFFDADVVNLSDYNLKGLKIKFKEGARVDLGYAKNLPKELDFSMCSKVNLRSCALEELDLKFREGAEVKLERSYSLPKELDVSMCSKVNLVGCNLEGLKLKFREGAEVNLYEAYNLPKDLDVSMCSKVNLSGCDLEGFNFKFREGAEVDLNRARNLPKDLDVSMCSRVGLVKCNLNGISLNFREGAEVDLEEAYNLPKELDLSMCSQVNLKDCCLIGVKKIKFKDRKQKREFMKEVKNFSGEVEYEETTFSKISKVFNKEM